MKVGDFFKFVVAPSRYAGDGQREPTEGLLGKTGIVLSYDRDDVYDWGGVWNLMVEGEMIQYYGDFLEVINEAG